ncbi:MAG TPA: tetratricopeptide repeat protein, partial [Halanaerobiales bacterium]|nr:tetratricopeptide repeat protein [Halanaerobiales bacterium]
EEIEFSVEKEKQSLIRETILDNNDALEMIDQEEYISEDEIRESKFAKALFYEKRRFYNNAIEIYNQIIEDNPAYIQAYVRKANCYLKKHDYERAINVLEGILRENYEDRELIYYYALALWHNKQRLKAKKHFYKIPNSSKYFAAASYFISMDYVVEGKYEKGVSKLEYSVKHQAFNYKSFLLYAYILIKSNKKEKAEEFLLDFLNDHPMDYIAMYLLDEARKDKKYYDIILSQKQNVYYILDFFNEVKDWNKCLEIIKDYARQKDACPLLSAYQYYYMDLIEGKNRQNLIDAIEKINLDYVFPNHSIDLNILETVKVESENASYLYGLLQYRAENYILVKQIWEDLISRDFSYSVLYRNLAYYYQKHEENYEKSREIAEMGFKKKPFNDDFFYILYKAYEHLGMKEKFNNLLQSIEEFENKSEPCIRVWIDMLNQLKKHEKAVKILERTNFNIYEHDPENLVPYPKIYKETYLGLTREALQIKDYDEAWKAIERCLDMEKRYEEKFAEIYFYAGIIKEKAGNFEEALAYYQKIVDENILKDDKKNYQYYVKAAHRMVKLNWIGIK